MAPSAEAPEISGHGNGAEPSTEAPETIGQGKYRVLGVLGQGGMATVYKVHDPDLDVTRAVKVLSPAYARFAVGKARFKKEGHAMARLEHEHIVRVYTAGNGGELPYIVMQYIDGETARKLMENVGGPLPPKEALTIIDAVLGALDYAHSKGIIHRDVKPENILIRAEDNHVFLADFGIAQVRQDNTDALTRAAQMGTIGYMAPEQKTNAKDVDARADIYSVGATLFNLVTNEPPIELSSLQDAPDLLELVPEPLRKVIITATRRNRDERQQSAAELRKEIRTLMRLDEREFSPKGMTICPMQDDDSLEDVINPTTAPQPAAEPPPVEKPSRKRVIAGAILALASLLTIGFFAQGSDPAEKQEMVPVSTAPPAAVLTPSTVAEPAKAPEPSKLEVESNSPPLQPKQETTSKVVAAPKPQPKEKPAPKPETKAETPKATQAASTTVAVPAEKPKITQSSAINGNSVEISVTTQGDNPTVRYRTLGSSESYKPKTLRGRDGSYSGSIEIGEGIEYFVTAEFDGDISKLGNPGNPFKVTPP